MRKWSHEALLVSIKLKRASIDVSIQQVESHSDVLIAISSRGFPSVSILTLSQQLH